MVAACCLVFHFMPALANSRSSVMVPSKTCRCKELVWVPLGQHGTHHHCQRGEFHHCSWSCVATNMMRSKGLGWLG